MRADSPRRELMADLERLYKLRPELMPDEVFISRGNWGYEGGLCADEIGDGAALKKIMESYQSGWFNRTIHGFEMGVREVINKPMPPTIACCDSLLHAAVKAALSGML